MTPLLVMLGSLVAVAAAYAAVIMHASGRERAVKESKVVQDLKLTEKAWSPREREPEEL